jgi:NhaP-type Na+/H+ or K+/H+ antiporter
LEGNRDSNEERQEIGMEIALGLFLNVLFWAVVVSVVVIAFVRYGAVLFPGRRRRGKKASSQASLTEKTEAERHGKAA